MWTLRSGDVGARWGRLLACRSRKWSSVSVVESRADTENTPTEGPAYKGPTWAHEPHRSESELSARHIVSVTPIVEAPGGRASIAALTQAL